MKRFLKVGALAQAVLAIAFMAQPAAAAEKDRPLACEAGAYRSGSGAVVALTNPPSGIRYTFDDGRRGTLDDSDKTVRCDGGALLVQGADGGTSAGQNCRYVLPAPGFAAEMWSWPGN